MKPTSAWIVVGPTGQYECIPQLSEDAAWEAYQCVSKHNFGSVELRECRYTCQRVTICSEGDARDAELEELLRHPISQLIRYYLKHQDQPTSWESMNEYERGVSVTCGNLENIAIGYEDKLEPIISALAAKQT